MTLARPDWRDRLRAAIPTGLIVGAMGYALVVGLGFVPPLPVTTEALNSFDVKPPAPPPPRIQPKRVQTHRPRGAAAPPNLRSQATEVVAPPPVVVLPPVSPVVVAPVAGTGVQASQGASDKPGPGTGAGGIGNGRGSGGAGDGDGYGDDTPPRRIKGRIKDSDYPEAAAEAGASGSVTVRYFVNVDGRVSGCVVTRSSGNAALDETTCRLIEQRYRYDPSRDADGRPVRSIIVVSQDWVLERASAER
ncbi:energy transducer TonB [uncultured Sphingomonas sp.]|uniref:energy transducer TonB n=1 Tax=uncultured Sphingomonas sp. TaxID=158754 RepID=UPI0025F6B17B|nr:TonB family protein [uncultured Sphingomonas sp.]